MPYSRPVQDAWAAVGQTADGGVVVPEEDFERAERLLADWDEGRGLSKSQIEIREWGDSTSHGRHFDRYIRTQLNIETTKPSKQTDRITELERTIRSLGIIPPGTEPPFWETQLQHARSSCLTAVRVWNDPSCPFRAGAFSLLLVTAWNSLAIAVISRSEGEWRKTDGDGQPLTAASGADLSRDTSDLVGEAFPTEGHRGLRENVAYWVDIRNAVAHRSMPALDMLVIPEAQASLLNFETQVVDGFGIEFALGDQLSIPLQLSGFRDPGALSSRKKLLAALPLDVQAILSRAQEATPELLQDPTFSLRVAFIPVVPPSGRSPDAVAYFVKPGDQPEELTKAIERYVVLTKPISTSRLEHAPKYVMEEVERRTGFRFNSNDHAAAARSLGVRPPKGQEERTLDLRYAEYITSFKRYLYSQAWIDLLAVRLAKPEDFVKIVGRTPQPVTTDNDQLAFGADPS